MNENQWLLALEQMIQTQIVARGVQDKRVLAALRAVPRHLFVAEAHREWAYSDTPLPIEEGQTISQPYMVALMTSLLELPSKGARVLEIGTGSGYQTAVLAHLADEVYSVERFATLSEKAAQRLAALGLDNVYLQVGDGTLGWEEHAPYDGILVTASAPKVPPALRNQLAEGGRLIIPIGSLGAQILECWQRQGTDYRRKRICSVAFVPLIGEQGWPER